MMLIGGYLRVPLIRQLAVAGLILAPIWLALHLWVFAPAQAAFEDARGETIALQNRLADLENRAGLRDQAADLTQQLLAVETRFAAPVERSALVDLIARMSKEAGTRILHGSNSFGDARDDVVPILQDLTVEGAYRDIRRFLTRLAEIETLTLVRSVEFSSNPDGTLVRVKMKLITWNGAGG